MCSHPPSPGRTAVLVTADHIGGDPELGAVLMQSFLNTLASAPARPDRVIFLNTGVNLTTLGSPVLDALRELAEAGVEILSCGTCLAFLEKKDRLAVGAVTTMHDTVDTITGPWRVVTIG